MDKVRSWLYIQPASPTNVDIIESFDYTGNALKNRIWYRGEGNELQQLYQQLQIDSAKWSFWAAKSTNGLEINKLHTGLPALIVDTLTSVTLAGLNDFAFEKDADKALWEDIDYDNKFKKRLEKAVKETLYIGDGAFKISFDSEVSEFPIIEYFPGDQIELKTSRGRLVEVVFMTTYRHKGQSFVLRENYGYGYVKYELTRDGKLVPLDSIAETANLQNTAFGGYAEDAAGKMLHKGEYMLAIPLQFFESGKWEGRGQSIYDRKIDNFDALDEAWSQWMDALRSGRTREYIPETLIPRDPATGSILQPNPFDNRFIRTDADMGEKASNSIELQQPAIPHESYLATYMTALDLCLQGLISPSTLGIDVKKLDNAEAQREKEKATLYTRNIIVDALQEDLYSLVNVALKAYREITTKRITEDIKVDILFSEYANPSFESQIETVGKGRMQGIMSIEASVEELYGDNKDEEWKKEEIARLKTEQGVMEATEPSVNTALGDFAIDLGGGNEGESNEPDMGDGTEGVPGGTPDSI